MRLPAVSAVTPALSCLLVFATFLTKAWAVSLTRTMEDHIARMTLSVAKESFAEAKSSDPNYDEREEVVTKLIYDIKRAIIDNHETGQIITKLGQKMDQARELLARIRGQVESGQAMLED
eukprot:comp18054_c0_seq1/m.18610 comp18054_c0_seq1/g.18610  ORF comp18054_c0_seq1/g.18610 comp18054_c0_seq1/m.18610 type:complete len:120 (-) comp18054_c0_seq1:328-687(-)